VERLLTTRSGLLGISGTSSDMRDLLEAERGGDERAHLAIEVFCYRVRKYIGAYMAALGGASAVVFGGGIGGNSPDIRARICDGMEWCGLSIDMERNAATVGADGVISPAGAPVAAYVVAVDENLLIAIKTIELISRKNL
jgi:acetate kinase